MNIFYVDTNPVKAAQSLVDKHVVKMILESAQLLSTAHRLLDGEQKIVLSETGRKQKRWVLPDERDPLFYQATHYNHPSSVWTRTAVENYLWLVDHFFGLLDEYKFRYGKTHKSSELGFLIQCPPLNLKSWDMTEMPCAMPDEYKVPGNSIESYRNYYRIGKASMHSWKNRQPPEWL